MSSILTAVFKATIGLLVNKGRDKVAQKLEGGDITDQTFLGLIVREIDDIKSKVDGSSRKDLLASISFFKEGIVLLYEAFDMARSRSDHGAVTTQKVFSLAREENTLRLADLNKSGTKFLSDAKRMFEKAREKAAEAFSDDALKTSDRILAMQYRVMATILEKIDNPADAVGPCRLCIEELHCLSAVQESFNVQLTNGVQAWFGKSERRRVITNVCHINFVIYSVTLMVSSGKELSNWPCIGCGHDKVDPLRNERVAAFLREQGMEYCCVKPWSFAIGQQGWWKHKLKEPKGIATNSSGQFIVADSKYSDVKVFDSKGKFMKRFSLPNDGVDSNTFLKLYVNDVATDINDNIYVLVFRALDKFMEEWEEEPLKNPKCLCYRPGAKRYVGCAYERAVYKFSNTSDLLQKFLVEHGVKLTVTDSGKLLVLAAYTVNEYETDGQFVCSFGKGILKGAYDITAANDGQVMVVEWRDSCVHIFSEHGDHLNKLNFQRFCSLPSITFHRASEQLVTASKEAGDDVLHVKIYTKDGEFVRSTQIHEERFACVRAMTVTTEGRIAAVCAYWSKMSTKVSVL